MADIDDGPLSEQQKQELVENIRNLRKLQLKVQQAGRAGIDVTATKAQTDELLQKMEQLKSVYAPNKAV